MDILREDLKSWLHTLIARHGAEAALILYPEDDRAQRFFDDVDARGFDQLPEREEEMKTLRAQALTLFIRSPTPDQRRFLAGLLNTSFYMTVLTIDPGAKNRPPARFSSSLATSRGRRYVAFAATQRLSLHLGFSCPS